MRVERRIVSRKFSVPLEKDHRCPIEDHDLRRALLNELAFKRSEPLPDFRRPFDGLQVPVNKIGRVVLIVDRPPRADRDDDVLIILRPVAKMPRKTRRRFFPGIRDQDSEFFLTRGIPKRIFDFVRCPMERELFFRVGREGGIR